jgi:alkanesulfonate monooxygenase SsuD/methylene tetrahydromethanopterin reductase-like flavin-dependent oxidoreductase (luciferase family)
MRYIGYPPADLATLRESMTVIKDLAEGRTVTYNGTELQFPWSRGSSLDVYMAAYGPKALALCGEVADGFILQLADPQIAAWTIEAVRSAASDAGRDPDAVKICVAAPAYVGDDLAHQRDQVRWFGGMVGNHGKATSTHVDFVTDDVIDRFCLLGPASAHVARLAELRDLGVDQFAIYLQHDAQDATLAAYGAQVLPALA